MKILLGCRKSHDVYFFVFRRKNASWLFRQPNNWKKAEESRYIIVVAWKSGEFLNIKTLVTK